MEPEQLETGPSIGVCCPSKSTTKAIFTWLVVFFVLGLLVVITISFSPGFGTSEGFDIISLSTTPIYQWLKDNPGNIRQLTGFIIVPFYVLIFCYLFACISRNTAWMLLDSVIGWLLAFTSCLCIGIPTDSSRIDYWSNSISPLEYFLIDNTVNMHVVVGFICSKTLVDVHGSNPLLQAVLFIYNALLALFTIVTKNSSSQAVLIGLWVGMSSTVIRTRVAELAIYYKIRMATKNGCSLCGICASLWTSPEELHPLTGARNGDSLAHSGINKNETNHVNFTDITIEDELQLL